MKTFLLIPWFLLLLACNPTTEPTIDPTPAESLSTDQLTNDSLIFSDFQDFIDMFPDFDYPYVANVDRVNYVNKLIPNKYIMAYYWPDGCVEIPDLQVYPIAKKREKNYWIFLCHVTRLENYHPYEHIDNIQTTLNGHCFLRDRLSTWDGEFRSISTLLSTRHAIWHDHLWYWPDSAPMENAIMVTANDTLGHYAAGAECIYPPFKTDSTQ